MSKFIEEELQRMGVTEEDMVPDRVVGDIAYFDHPKKLTHTILGYEIKGKICWVGGPIDDQYNQGSE